MEIENVTPQVEPALGPEHYQSYQIAAPTSTHWRDATCEEARCDKFISGFYLDVDETSPLGQFQASYLRQDRTRAHLEERVPPGMTRFLYPPGSSCFGVRHKIRLDRPEHFLITGGDRRGNPRGLPRRELRSEDWVDDFANHQDKIAGIRERG